MNQPTFSEQTPGVLAATWQATPKDDACYLMLIESMDEWSAYIDGNPIGTEFRCKADAIDAVMTHLAQRQKSNRMIGAAKSAAAVVALIALTPVLLAALGAISDNPIVQALSSFSQTRSERATPSPKRPDATTPQEVGSVIVNETASGPTQTLTPVRQVRLAALEPAAASIETNRQASDVIDDYITVTAETVTDTDLPKISGPITIKVQTDTFSDGSGVDAREPLQDVETSSSVLAAVEAAAPSDNGLASGNVATQSEGHSEPRLTQEPRRIDRSQLAVKDTKQSKAVSLRKLDQKRHAKAIAAKKRAAKKRKIAKRKLRLRKARRAAAKKRKKYRRRAPPLIRKKIVRGPDGRRFVVYQARRPRTHAEYRRLKRLHRRLLAKRRYRARQVY